MIEHQDQEELFPLVHQPMYPPRKGHDGEQVYAAMWEATMSAEVDDALDDIPILRVLNNFPKKITQRHATIIATVATWLGTSVGNSVLHRALQIKQLSNIVVGHHPYLLAWTLENKRVSYANHGVRCVEFLLAPPELVVPRAGLMHSGLRELPELSADDLEVIDHFMMWLSEPEGQRFIQRSEAKLAGILEEKRLLKLAEFNMRRNAAARIE